MEVAQAHKISPKALFDVITSKKHKSGGEFTVRSLRTGKDFTYKINRSKWQERFFTHVKVEVGYLQWRYLGTYKAGKITRRGSLINSESAIAIAWILNRVENQRFDLLDRKIDIFHLGRCLSCGRTLTDSNSIERGLGPVCATFNF